VNVGYCISVQRIIAPGGKNMSAETASTVEEPLRQLLLHLGIERAHFAGRTPRDWTALAAAHPEVFASLTVIGGFDPQPVERLADRLLAVTGDQGPVAVTVRSAIDRLPGAQLVALRDYNLLGWSDLTAERTDELGAAMLDFSLA
jgi:hypothetical protein